jgi:hypothetical protein
MSSVDNENLPYFRRREGGGDVPLEITPAMFMMQE